MTSGSDNTKNKKGIKDNSIEMLLDKTYTNTHHTFVLTDKLQYDWSDVANYSGDDLLETNNTNMGHGYSIITSGDIAHSFTEVEFITNGDTLVLSTKNPSNQLINKQQESNFLDYVSTIEKIIDINDKDSSFSFDYKENQGADFLESSIEERLPFEIKQSKEGDVYKILRDSFSNGSDVLEIEGYDISTDKLDLADFIREFNDIVNYSLYKDHDNLNLNVYNGNNTSEYSIILKDAISNTDANLDDILQNLIIKTSGEKI